jgi:hypothetical protein
MLANDKQFWDSITKEDFEFSVGIKPNNWEIKELLPASGGELEDRRGTLYQQENYSEYSNSLYNLPPATKRSSGYGWNY